MCSHPRLGGVQARTEDNDRSNNVHLPYIVHLEFITYDGLGPTLRGNYSDTGIFKLYGSNASINHYYVSHRNYDPGWKWYCSVYIYTFTQSNQKMLTEVLIFTFHL